MGRVLVTGGAGYIGSFATQALLRAGHETVVYDDLSQGHREAVERLAAGHPGKVTLIEGDIRDTAKVRAALTDHRIGAVMHFAARLIVPESVRKPAEYYDANVGGALSVLNAMRDAGVSRFIFSSTCATFGEPVETPMAEDHPQRPINAYGETKLAVERALPHYERAYGIQLGGAALLQRRRGRSRRRDWRRSQSLKSISFRARLMRPWERSRWRCSGTTIRRRTGRV